MIVPALLAFLTEQEIQRGRVLVAISGGGDSVALLRGLQSVAGELELQLIAGHFNHQLRDDADDDAEWVTTLCGRLGIECHVGTSRRAGDVSPPMTVSEGLRRVPPGWLAERNETVEEQARRQRYRFLYETAVTIGCRWVAVAHTADDQVETVLHHILRGSGLKGLQGMPARRWLQSDDSSSVELIRPLLHVRRCDVLAYLDSVGQDYRTDPTNVDPSFTRNRIRHRVLPFLREHVNPQVDDALLRLAVQATDAQRTLEELAAGLLAKAALERQRQFVKLDCVILQREPLGLVREAFSLLWKQQGWPRQSMNFAHYDHLARLALSGASSQHSLPGSFRALKRRNILEIRQ